MKYIILFIFMFSSFILKPQVLSVNNGFLHTTTKYDSKDKCNHNSYSMLVSLDYLQNRHYYISSQIGYFSTGYFAHNYDLVGNIADHHKFITDDLHLSTTFRGKIPINNMYIYAGFGPKIDYSFNKRKKITGYDYFDPNSFENIFGVKIDLGFCIDLDRIRLGLNAAYLSNLNSGKFNSKKYLCGLSIGYIFKKTY